MMLMINYDANKPQQSWQYSKTWTKDTKVWKHVCTHMKCYLKHEKPTDMKQIEQGYVAKAIWD
jgi:hypothetical protein